MTKTQAAVRRHTRGVNALVLLAAILWLLAPVVITRGEPRDSTVQAPATPRLVHH